MNKAEEIKDKLDIVDIIGEYLNLKALGSNFRALCPFHNEKTPSFMVSPDKQIWRCFGCGQGGDLISFIMKIEGLDFIEALKFLAPRAGVLLEGREFSDNSKKNTLLQILDLAKKYYHFILNSEQVKNKEAEKIKGYLLDRGLKGEALDYWQIGYSLNDSTALINFLRKKNFKDKDILDAGLAYRHERGQYFDRFRDRIMFPINDLSGNVIAFTARLNPFSENSKDLGKYINSPQGFVYDKSKVLFGIDKAKMVIREKDQIILVEGQMDAISAHEANFKNVVAVSGTALTRDHLNIIKRYTRNIALAFDQDSAGETATDRGVLEALKMDFNLKIAKIKEGKDPDDLIREDPQLFQKAIDESQDIMNYYLEREFSRIDINDHRERREATSKVLEIISNLYNKVEQDFWIKELNNILKVNEVFLREELGKIIDKSNKINRRVEEKTTISPEKESRVEDPWEDKLIKTLLALIIKFKEHFSYLQNNLDPSFLTENYREFYNLIHIYYNKNKDLEYQALKKFFQEEGHSTYLGNLEELSLLADFYQDEGIISEDNAKDEIIKNIIEIKKLFFKRALGKESELLTRAEKEKDELAISETMKKIKDLNDSLQKINN